MSITKPVSGRGYRTSEEDGCLVIDAWCDPADGGGREKLQYWLGVVDRTVGNGEQLRIPYGANSRVAQDKVSYLEGNGFLRQ